MVRDNASTRASGVNVLRKSFRPPTFARFDKTPAASRTAVLGLIPNRRRVPSGSLLPVADTNRPLPTTTAVSVGRSP